MKYDTLKALVNAKVYENTEQRITGGDMNDVLQSAIASLGAHYQMGGLVSPTDRITVRDEPVVFLATTPGTYTYFGGLVVADGEVALLVWSGTAWSKQTPDISTRTEVNQLGQKSAISIGAGRVGPDGEIQESETRGYTDYILIAGASSISIIDGADAIFAIGNVYLCLYGSDYSFIRNISSDDVAIGSAITLQSNEYFMRVTVASYSGAILYSLEKNAGTVIPKSTIDDGAVTTSKLATGAVTTVKIANDSVTSDKLYVPSNIFSLDTPLYEGDLEELYLFMKCFAGAAKISLRYYSGDYLMRAFDSNNSAIWTARNSAQSFVDGKVFPIVCTSAGGGVSLGDICGYFVFKNITHFKANPSGNDIYYINGDRSKNLSWQPLVQNYVSDMITSAKLVDGAVTTSKIADGAVTAQKLASNAIKTNEKGVKMALGTIIPAINGKEIRIYYKSLFGVANIYDYQVIVTGSIGKAYQRFWSFTPSSSNVGETYNVKFSLVYSNGDVIIEKTTHVNVLATPQFSDKNILVVGASVYATGTISKELSRMLSGTGGTPSGYGLSGISFIGRLTGSIEQDIRQEATTGWGWDNYTQKNTDNPFYNPNTGEIDFAYYSQQYCGGEDIDVLCIEFGWNGLWDNPYIVDTKIKPFLRQFHSDFPDGKIIFGGLQAPSQGGGLGWDYGSSQWWNWLTTFNAVLDYNNIVIDICEDVEFSGYITYWPACETFDCENSYPSTQVYVNLRSTVQETIETNGIHPTEEERKQFSDSALLAICSAFSV